MGPHRVGGQWRISFFVFLETFIEIFGFLLSGTHVLVLWLVMGLSLPLMERIGHCVVVATVICCCRVFTCMRSLGRYYNPPINTLSFDVKQICSNPRILESCKFGRKIVFVNIFWSFVNEDSSTYTWIILRFYAP